MKKQILLDNLEQLETKEYTKLTPILVPETWEELKELCKEIGIEVEENYIELFGILVGSSIMFCKDGAIMLNTDCCFAEKVSIERMWQIIKNLIGEER